MDKRKTFNDLSLSNGMKQTLQEIGFNDATPIQERAIPELLAGRDLLGQAQTGTGKTAAFSIPLIEKVNINNKNIQALVVCPTRELCLQVCQEIKRLASHTEGVSAVALYGGQAIEQQMRALKTQKPQIVVATPGRLFDHLRRGSIDLSSVVMITLDEADEMLDMGFRGEIEQIFELLPESCQRIFFSATMPKAILDLVHTYLIDPIIIKTESKNLTVARIDQSYYRVRGKEKIELLCRVLDYRNPKLAVVFCNAKSTADEIVEQIKFRGFEAGVLHGDLNQNQRDRVMAKFRGSQIKVLVATDIAARGIDVDDVELVLNFHLPHDPEDYVHRIGRTGRAGRKGRAISLVEPRDNSRLRKIVHFARADINEEEPPSINDVKTAKLSNLFSKVEAALSSELIGEYRAFLSKQSLDSQDIAAGLIKIALEKFDEHAMDDASFMAMQGKRYSGMGFGGKKRNEREDRGSFRRRDRERGFRNSSRRQDDFKANKGERDFSPFSNNSFKKDGRRSFGEAREERPMRAAPQGFRKERNSSNDAAGGKRGFKGDRSKPDFGRSSKPRSGRFTKVSGGPFGGKKRK
ncbi:MAG: DEAD/DEAH box helicase [Myxococcales bacterium]|nr:DEAD/DEAH box helicase [Myxococcales bacterium]USN51891.1 MAG: DEAD/DEAH box helicase [Myxococcales bacterium]